VTGKGLTVHFFRQPKSYKPQLGICIIRPHIRVLSLNELPKAHQDPLPFGPVNPGFPLSPLSPEGP